MKQPKGYEGIYLSPEILKLVSDAAKAQLSIRQLFTLHTPWPKSLKEQLKERIV